MTVKFSILDSKYLDGTENGFRKYLANSIEITEEGCSDVESAIKKWRKKYPAKRYDVDNVCWG